MENGMNYLWFHHQTNMQGGDGLYSRMSGNQIFRETVDPELDHKTRRVSDKFSENINTIANEPSLAFFRIQEHVRKTLPQLVEQKHEVQNIQQKVQGACFDTEYATNAVKTMYQSEFHFQNIQELLKNAMFMKQQIGYEETRRKQESSNPSMYSPPVGGQGAGGPTMTESTQSSDSSLAHSGHGQTSEPGSSPPNSSPSLSIVSTSPASAGATTAHTVSPTTTSASARLAASAVSSNSDSSLTALSVHGPANVRAVGIASAGSVGSQSATQTLSTVESLNCDSDDIDVATEVDEQSALS